MWALFYYEAGKRYEDMKKLTKMKKTAPWSPWRFIVWFGVVSLFADFVYEGARSVTGPYLATLGASAALVGLITGIGEAFALAGRLGTGPLADKTKAYWPLAIGGYALTVISVPLLGAASFLWLAAVLVIAERAGKAIRSPAKDIMLSQAASSVGRGKGFAIHEALDQIGAFIGPLVVAGVLALTSSYSLAFALLAAPGIVVLYILFWLKKKVPDPTIYEARESTLETSDTKKFAIQWRRLPNVFWWYLAFTMLTTAGYATFGVISFHLAKEHLFTAPVIPLIYAVAMGVDAIAALIAGFFYDKIGRRSLLVVPFLTAIIPLTAFTISPAWAFIGVLTWGAVMGIHESTMRAAIADLIPTHIRGTAYGVFAAGFGLATFVGGVLSGILYGISLTTLIIVVALLQVVAFCTLVYSLKAGRSSAV